MPESLKIVTYPDPFLRRRVDDVDEVDDDVRSAVAGMLHTMYENRGVGLAASQVGVNRRILTINPTGDPEDELVLINPVIAEARGAMEGEEGCLSFPGVSGIVVRSANITVASYDLEGNEVKIVASDFLARVLQHEIDHLEGMLFVDRMTPESRISARDALKILEDAFREGETPGEPH